MRVEVPVCSLRKPHSREFLDSETVPPPSTVYGFLLSFIGEGDRSAHIGSCLAYAIVQEPIISTVLRKYWRVKDGRDPQGSGVNNRPELQKILCGLTFLLWVKGSLADRLLKAHEDPESIDRFGVLSLGESTGMVDTVKFFPEMNGQEGDWLSTCRKGRECLPVWADHTGNKETVWSNFQLVKGPLEEPPEGDPRWIEVRAS